MNIRELMTVLTQLPDDTEVGLRLTESDGLSSEHSAVLDTSYSDNEMMLYLEGRVT